MSIGPMNLREWIELGEEIRKLERSLRMAEIRVLTFDELNDRLAGILADQLSEEIIRRVSELVFDRRQVDQLFDTIQTFACASEHLDSRQKARADAIVGRLVRLLPADVAVPFALAELTHHRKRRREGGYKILKRHTLAASLAPRLVEAYVARGDSLLLQLIARNPAMLAYVDVSLILTSLEDGYWRMRIVEGLLTTNDCRSSDIAQAYATEFAHAVGRLQLKREVDRLKVLCDQDTISVEFLSLYTWAMGRLGVKNEVVRMKRLADDLRRGFDATELPPM